MDYRGSEVSVESFLRLLMGEDQPGMQASPVCTPSTMAFAGRHDPAVPRSKRLLSDEGSNVFVMLTGHGGDGFIKFQVSIGLGCAGFKLNCMTADPVAGASGHELRRNAPWRCRAC